jgi:hypothetical protein
MRAASTITVPVVTCLPVLYGCETWSATLRAEYKKRVFGNRVLRKIFVTKAADVRGGLE